MSPREMPRRRQCEKDGMKPKNLGQEQGTIWDMSTLPFLGSATISLRSVRLVLFLICLLVQAATLFADGPDVKGSSEKSREVTVGSPAGNSSKDRDLLVDCSKGGSHLPDQALCSDVQIRAAAVQVPEPSSLFLVGCGLLLMAALLHRRFIRTKSPDSASR
jgi:hypothetical protein